MEQVENGLVLASFMVTASQSTLLNGEAEEKIEHARMERIKVEKEQMGEDNELLLSVESSEGE